MMSDELKEFRQEHREDIKWVVEKIDKLAVKVYIGMGICIAFGTIAQLVGKLNLEFKQQPIANISQSRIIDSDPILTYKNNLYKFD